MDLSGLLQCYTKRAVSRQSAVIDVPVPSTRTLTYLIAKSANESAELVLANVRKNDTFSSQFFPVFTNSTRCCFMIYRLARQ